MSRSRSKNSSRGRNTSTSLARIGEWVEGVGKPDIEVGIREAVADIKVVTRH